MKISLALVTLAVTGAAAQAAINRPWGPASDPIHLGQNFVRRFAALPLAGEVSDTRKYWSGDYWALRRGNINYRWNAPVPAGFRYRSPGQDEVAQLSEAQLAVLSPAEKFDLLRGFYHYPLRREVEAFTAPDKADWEGMCHGAAPASMHHNEPLPKTIRNPDGVLVPFGSSDIKALLSYYYAYKYNAPSRYLGFRCRSRWTPEGHGQCREDLNAGAFHIALANRMGLEGLTFVADIEDGKEVWNHIPVGYCTRVLNPSARPQFNSAPGTVRTAKLQTTVTFVNNSPRNTWEPVLGTSLQITETRTYEYALDLDRSGSIIGGNWSSKVRPDFIWDVDPVPFFEGDWGALALLLDDHQS